MRFNGENVRMSPWKIQVRGSQKLSNSGYDVDEHVMRSTESRRYDIFISVAELKNA